MAARVSEMFVWLTVMTRLVVTRLVVTRLVVTRVVVIRTTATWAPRR